MSKKLVFWQKQTRAHLGNLTMEKFEKSPVDSPRKVEDVIERRLLSVLFWCLVPSRILGYFPYTIQNGTRLTFSWRSASAIWTMVVLVFALYMAYLTWNLRNALWQLSHLYSWTERFAFFLLHASMVGFSLSCKSRSFFGAKHHLDLWKLHTDFLTNFYRLSHASEGIIQPDLDDPDNSKYTGKFASLRVRFTKYAAFNVVICIIHLTTIYFAIPDWNLKLVQLYWCLILDLHPVFAAVTTLLPRVMTICLEIMRDELAALATDGDDSLDTFVEESTGSGGGYGRFGNNGDSLVHPTQGKLIEDKTNGVNAFIAVIYVNSSKHNEGGGGGIGSIKPNGYGKRIKIEQMVNRFVDEYYKIEEQIRLYNKFYGRHLVSQILLEIVTLLTFTFLCFIWGATGQWGIVAISIFPLVLYVSELHALASAGNDLHGAGVKLLNVLYCVPGEHLTEDARSKMELLAIKIATNPPQIQPCNYFTLNKRLITSIFSALTTYIIVLVQFQTSDISKRGAPE